ncbi:RsmB/NOP family class I SAM-dependent RNA methyltransferase [Magnetospira sp. QH-2]|uniref:RsmB/NOP family class I SAM-dependent RNA methyltransferase n=1 Tax=Magnetospira sp. (strain QH-2) TaxID=1288970 RepID=UPI0003E81B3E|nr:RsmB/NOP family class I SAM-dependent RNA methyltransferase [Magnetospira sp. QH-2]CCQ74382.1 Ribosomal RNA small subunit methyltransferase B [Magnetospira sp. QH-2]
MTPGARIKASVELLLEIDQGRQPADTVMNGYFRSRRYVGSRDRRSISDMVYNMIRRRSGLDWWIDRVMASFPTSKPLDGAGRLRARIITDLILNGDHRAAQMSELFNGNRHCPNLLTAHERALAEHLEGQPFDHEEMPANVAYEFPAWMEPHLMDRWGDDLGRQMQALNRPAPVDLRVNLIKGTRDEARSALTGEGLFAENTPLSPLGLRLTGRARLGGLSAFQNGQIDVQDEGSQILSLLVDARPGMTVVDFCAGAGGKSLALAGSMGTTAGKPDNLNGRIIACDVSNKRLRRMDNRLVRAGIRTGVIRRTLSSEQDRWVDRNKEVAQRVLVDAPCSGSGTWRRNPDQKDQVSAEEFAALLRRQQSILEHAARLVQPGGRLIYATCAMLSAENEDQVTRFLNDRDGFRILPIGEIWGETVGGDCPADGPFLQLTPADTNTDGFFCAVLERTG